MPHLKYINCAVCGCPTRSAELSRRPQLADLCPKCLLLPQTKLSQQMLKIIFSYNKQTGALTYARDFPKRPRGGLATFEGGEGYLNVYLSGNKRAHRIIWLLETGEDPVCIDHINHDRKDNRWENLRNTTVEGNARNSSPNRTNKVGFTGVRRITGRHNFRAEITVNGKIFHLGTFATPEAASEAYRQAAQAAGFHRNHGKTMGE